MLEMIIKQKIFLEYYKTPVTMDFDGINDLEEGLSVILRKSIMKKVLLETKGKFKIRYFL